MATLKLNNVPIITESGGVATVATALVQEGTGINSTGESGGTKFLREDGDATCSWQAVEGTGIKSTGESGGTKFLREDGDGTSSWQVAGSPSITDGGNAMAITIDSSERVGIGIAPTAYKLTVDGDGSRLAFSAGGSYPFMTGIRSNRSGTTSGNMYIETWRGDGGNTPVTAIAIEGAAADVLPGGDNTQDLGSSAKRWKNIYTTDLHLANDRGNWTVIEEEDYLTIRNNKTNKVFKLVMEEIE